jgi:hypothetical protein
MFLSPLRGLGPLLALWVASCTLAGGDTRRPEREATARRAALARITVENRTERPLSIAFLEAALPRGEVVVGDVAPQSTRVVAPVVAGEPIILLARAADGAVLRLRPRTFENGEAWTWIIPADAPFHSAEVQP